MNRPAAGTGERDRAVDLPVVGQRVDVVRQRRASSGRAARPPRRASRCACHAASPCGGVARVARSAAFRSPYDARVIAIRSLASVRPGKSRASRSRSSRGGSVGTSAANKSSGRSRCGSGRFLKRPANADRTAMLVEIADRRRLQLADAGSCLVDNEQRQACSRSDRLDDALDHALRAAAGCALRLRELHARVADRIGAKLVEVRASARVRCVSYGSSRACSPRERVRRRARSRPRPLARRDDDRSARGATLEIRTTPSGACSRVCSSTSIRDSRQRSAASARVGRRTCPASSTARSGSSEARPDCTVIARRRPLLGCQTRQRSRAWPHDGANNSNECEHGARCVRGGGVRRSATRCLDALGLPARSGCSGRRVHLEG